jgi:hypothetical protein
MPDEVARLRFDPCDNKSLFRLIAIQLEKCVIVPRFDPSRLSAGNSKISKTSHTRNGAQFNDAYEHFLHIVEQARLVFGKQAATTNAASEPLISLIVPVYNASPAHLDDLLNSYRQQSAGVSELILSDDGSGSPETRLWLDRHVGDTDLIIVMGKENRGIALATNEGIRASRGEWIGLIDHDDALAPFAIAAIAKAISDGGVATSVEIGLRRSPAV